jgi:hypothetical protein
MALPVIGVPKYETTIPSTGEKVLFRPFLVKEEKILLLAMEAGDTKAQNRALMQILKNCVEGDIAPESLPVFDVEYLFVQIRGKSVGETLEPVVSCPKCDVSGKMKIDLSEVEVNKEKMKEIPHKIMVNDSVGITLRYPTLSLLSDIDLEKGMRTKDSETVFSIVERCLDSIFDQDQIYDLKNHTKKEISEFIENLTADAFQQIIEFISSMPRVEKKMHFKCPSCGHEQDVQLRGIDDFFGTVSLTIA